MNTSIRQETLQACMNGTRQTLSFLTLAFVLCLSSVALAGPEPGPCDTDDDCLDGMTCEEGMCSFWSECNTDDDCAELYGAGYYCAFAGCGGASCIAGPTEPECEVDADCEACGSCIQGECYPNSADMCETDAHCQDFGADQVCQFNECGNRCVTSAELSCTESGGTWDECAHSSCEGCDDCVAACVCRPGFMLQVDRCIPDEPVDPQSVACTESGGTYDACGAASCPTCADCVAVCDCPEGLTDQDGVCVSDSGEPQPQPETPAGQNEENAGTAGSQNADGCTAAGTLAPTTHGTGLLLLVLTVAALLGRRRVRPTL